MKDSFKHSLSFIFAILISIQVFSQTVQQSTTELEYNYVVNGYKHDFANGQDIKKGYSLNEIQQNTIGERKVQIKGLYRTGESSPCALMVIYNKEGQSTQYFCVPTYNADAALWQKFYESLNDDNGSQENKYHLILFSIAKVEMKAFQGLK